MVESLPFGISIVISLIGIVTLGFIFAIVSNSTIDRIPKSQSVVSPGPYCRSCAAPYTWKDLIPIMSYFRSDGKCPYCGSDIPIRNLIVDVAQVAWVALFVLKFGWSYHAILEMLFGMGLIAIIAIVTENRRLSGLVLLLLGMLSTVYVLGTRPEQFPAAVMSFLLGGLIMIVYNFLKVASGIRGRLDFSEVKFGAILGLFLGMEQIILSLFLAVFLGAAIGSVEIKFMRKSDDNAVPDFPTLMAAAGLITILFGQELLDFYVRIGV